MRILRDSEVTIDAFSKGRALYCFDVEANFLSVRFRLPFKALKYSDTASVFKAVRRNYCLYAESMNDFEMNRSRYISLD